jgi:hypothetical protein
MTKNVRALAELISEELGKVFGWHLTYDAKCYLNKIIIGLGGKFIGNGCFTWVYEFEGYCVKLTDDNAASPKLQNEYVKAWTPKIHWVDSSGRVFVCDLVSIDKDYIQRVNQDYSGREYAEFLKFMREVSLYFSNETGIELWDLGLNNLVRDVKGSYWIVDIGCFLCD